MIKKIKKNDAGGAPTAASERTLRAFTGPPQPKLHHISLNPQVAALTARRYEYALRTGAPP